MMLNIPEPWKSFLSEIDESLAEETRLEILGGFIITIMYGAPRTTSDVDIVAVVPNTQTRKLIELAGEFSTLPRKYGVYLDRVGVAALPESYEDRLAEIFPGVFKKLGLMRLILMISRSRRSNAISTVIVRTFYFWRKASRSISKF